MEVETMTLDYVTNRIQKVITISENRVVIGILFIGQFLFLLCGIHKEPVVYDEGFMVYYAEKVLNGGIPYRDFITAQAPGQFYTLAALFKMFGSSLLVERLWDTLARWAVSLLVYIIAAKLTSRRIAFVAWIAVTLLISAYSRGFNYGYGIFPSIAFGLLGVSCLLEHISRRKPFLLIGSGISIALSTFYRYDLGFYTCICIGLTYAAFVFLDHKERHDQLIKRIFATVQSMIPLVAAVVIPLIPLFCYLIVAVPIDELRYDILVYPTTIHGIHGLPYPPLLPKQLSIQALDKWVRFYLPLFVFTIAPLWGALSLVEKQNPNQRSIRVWGVILLTLLGLAFFLQAWDRADIIHLIPASIPALVLLVTMVANLPRPLRTIYCVAPICFLIIILSYFYIAMPARRHLHATKEAFLHPAQSSKLVRAGSVAIKEDQEQAVLYIQNHTAPSEPIFVGNSRHDRIFINDLLFYFLAARRSPTKYDHLIPGIATTLPVQKHIVEDLMNSKVRFVITWSGFENHLEPNKGGESSGITVLDEFIRSNYQIVDHFGDYSIWQKNQKRTSLHQGYAAQKNQG